MPAWMLLLPFTLQGVAMTVDEFYFHRRRGLPLWERIGHPLDTLTLLVCALWASEVSYTPELLPVYASLASFSCVFVTKDEWVHKAECEAGEQWLHSLLFVLHPCVLFAWGLAWASRAGGVSALDPWLLRAQAIGVFAFLLYQIFYWNFLVAREPGVPKRASP